MPPKSSAPKKRAAGKAPAPTQSTGEEPDAESLQWPWTRQQEECVCSFFEREGRDGVAGGGYADYLRNKKEECQKLLTTMKRDKNLNCQDLAIKQVVGKTARMIKTYKELVDVLENATGGGVDPDTHETATWTWDKKGKGNKRKETIKSYLDRVCPWYYRFDDVMGKRPSVKPPTLMEGGTYTRQKQTPKSKKAGRAGGRDEPITLDGDTSDLTSLSGDEGREDEEDELADVEGEEQEEDEDEVGDEEMDGDQLRTGQSQIVQQEVWSGSEGDLGEATEAEVQAILDQETNRKGRNSQPANKASAAAKKKPLREGDKAKEAKAKGKGKGRADLVRPQKPAVTPDKPDAVKNTKQQTPSRLPGASQPRKSTAGGSEVASAMESMVNAEQRQRQHDRAEKAKDAAAAREVEQARLNVEREKVQDNRSIEERKLAAAEAKEAHERAQEQSERDERREEREWRRELDREQERRAERRREEEREERRDEARREEKRREREENQRSEDREFRMMMLMRQMNSQPQPSSNAVASPSLSPFPGVYHQPYSVNPHPAMSMATFPAQQWHSTAAFTVPPSSAGGPSPGMAYGSHLATTSGGQFAYSSPVASGSYETPAPDVGPTTPQVYGPSSFPHLAPATPQLPSFTHLATPHLAGPHLSTPQTPHRPQHAAPPRDPERTPASDPHNNADRHHSVQEP